RGCCAAVPGTAIRASTSSDHETCRSRRICEPSSVDRTATRADLLPLVTATAPVPRRRAPGACRAHPRPGVVILQSTCPVSTASRQEPHENQVGEWRSEEHTSELQSRFDLVCRLLLEKKKEEE